MTTRSPHPHAKSISSEYTGHNRSVGIYKLCYPNPSETFITTQAKALARYEPLILARKRIDVTDIATLAVSDHDNFGIRQGWLSFTRSPSLFLSDARVRNLSLIHAHSGPDGVYALKLAEALASPLVVTFHGQDATSRKWPLFRSLFGMTIVTYFRLLHRLKTRGAAFIAVSDFIHHCLLAQGFPPQKIHRLHIGVDTARFSPLPERDSGDNVRFILNVARHVPVKGVDSLLRSFALVASEHPRILLLQVGAGPLTGYLHGLARDLGIADRVRFLGSVTHEEVRTLMQRAEIVALSSKTADTGAQEALGMVLNEASACGIPLVATKSGGILEAVIHGETGLLSPPCDDLALAHNMNQLLSDEGLRRCFGLRGREFVCDQFCLRKQTAKLEYLYDRLVENKLSKGRVLEHP
jgi:colanic acid/amylovoran biosynthesis glycosyltransferase